MSVDTHKFGQAHKGSSLVLYRKAELRRAQYTRITDWSGGLYISPGFAHLQALSSCVRGTCMLCLIPMRHDGDVSFP